MCFYIGSTGRFFDMSMSTSQHISLSISFSSGDLVEWFRRFEVRCHANIWNDKTKAKKLLTLNLAGGWSYRSYNNRTKRTCSTAKSKIVEQMVPACFIALADLRESHCDPVNRHELKRLLKQLLPATVDNKFIQQQFSHPTLQIFKTSLTTTRKSRNVVLLVPSTRSPVEVLNLF